MIWMSRLTLPTSWCFHGVFDVFFQCRLWGMSVRCSTPAAQMPLGVVDLPPSFSWGFSRPRPAARCRQSCSASRCQFKAARGLWQLGLFTGAAPQHGRDNWYPKNAKWGKPCRYWLCKFTKFTMHYQMHRNNLQHTKLFCEARATVGLRHFTAEARGSVRRRCVDGNRSVFEACCFEDWNCSGRAAALGLHKSSSLCSFAWEPKTMPCQFGGRADRADRVPITVPGIWRTIAVMHRTWLQSLCDPVERDPVERLGRGLSGRPAVSAGRRINRVDKNTKRSHFCYTPGPHLCHLSESWGVTGSSRQGACVFLWVQPSWKGGIPPTETERSSWWIACYTCVSYFAMFAVACCLMATAQWDQVSEPVQVCFFLG